jgi:formylglycine-generating enzyme required for sulfatase activity
MVTIPAGAFTMGSDDGPPDEVLRHQVELAAYAIDRLRPTRNSPNS